MDTRGNELIKEIRKIVREACKDDWNWEYHILPVVRHAAELAIATGADAEIVEISAWLHDLTRLRGDDENHNLTGAIAAKDILTKLGYPRHRIDQVMHCIESHRGKGDIPQETLEAKCVASADAMAHLSDIPALLQMIFVSEGKSIEEGRKWMRRKIERSWGKMMPEAQEIMREKYEAARLLFS